MFEIIFEKRVVGECKKLPKKVISAVLSAINDRLANNPFPAGKNPKKLKGGKNCRLRVGKYRILYEIEENTVRIFSIIHRKDAYR